MRRFIDIGANLTDCMYSGIYHGKQCHESDLLMVLNRCWESGLSKIIITGVSLEGSKSALTLTELDERLYSTVGCHPTHSTEFETNSPTPQQYYEDLKQLAIKGGKKVVAIGECGLDYDRLNFCSKDIQKKYFEQQLNLSKTLNLPLFLHCRNAASDLREILSKFSGLRGVVHSFDGTFEEAENFIQMGFFIGLNGCSLKSADNLEVVKRIPSDKILLESDSPWCEIRPSHAGYQFINKEYILESVKKEKWSPNKLVKGRNEPSNIRHVLDVISTIRNENADEIAKTTYENTVKLFFQQI